LLNSLWITLWRYVDQNGNFACRLARLWAVRAVFICESSEATAFGFVERPHAESVDEEGHR